MQENRSEPAARTAGVPHQSLILWLLFLGVALSFGGNVYQDLRANALEKNLASVRQETQKQIADLREAQTASLEQDLLRLDQLTGQVQKTNEDILRQSTMAADRTKAELARTVEQRHQEMIRALSDIRSDLRTNTNAKQSPGPRDIQEASSQPEQPSGEVAAAAGRSTVSNTSHQTALLPSDTEAVEQDQPQEPNGKKRFWSKLNPFSRNKKKPAATDASVTSQ